DIALVGELQRERLLEDLFGLFTEQPCGVDGEAEPGELTRAQQARLGHIGPPVGRGVPDNAEQQQTDQASLPGMHSTISQADAHLGRLEKKSGNRNRGEVAGVRRRTVLNQAANSSSLIAIWVVFPASPS